jgi:hypothetical protein
LSRLSEKIRLYEIDVCFFRPHRREEQGHGDADGHVGNAIAKITPPKR